MKRTSLTTAVIAGIAGVAGIAGTANAVFLNTDGLGEVLVYPYYTVNGGNSTLLSVVNTHNEGKAVKVRFLEAYDSREVLDFNLYLSPFDVWVAQVIPLGGGAGVFTNDNSCTVPTLPNTAGTAQPFYTYAFDGGLDGQVDFPTDQGPTGVSRTLEGYIELIEMGVVTNTDEGTLDAITHHNGVPANCPQVVDAWNGGYWGGSGANENTDIGSPDGGLFGSGTVLNHDAGQIFGYNADAIDQFYTPGTVGQQTNPQDLSPSISSGTSNTSYVFANGALATTTYNLSIDAVSSLFTATAVLNEYVVAATIGASTEWVVTFPTKRFYVDPNYVGAVAAARPFDVVFGSTGDATSCVPVSITYYNREEGSPGGSIGFSPRPVHGNSLCYEAQVVTFGQGATPSKVLGSHLVTNIATIYPTGWAQIGFTTETLHAVTPNRAAPIVGENTFYGLPVTGFSVTNYVNGELTDTTTGNTVLSNYSGLYRHKFNRLCTSSSTSTTLTACS